MLMLALIGKPLLRFVNADRWEVMHEELADKS